MCIHQKPEGSDVKIVLAKVMEGDRQDRVGEFILHQEP